MQYSVSFKSNITDIVLPKITKGLFFLIDYMHILFTFEEGFFFIL